MSPRAPFAFYGYINRLNWLDTDEHNFWCCCSHTIYMQTGEFVTSILTYALAAAEKAPLGLLKQLLMCS